MRGLGGVGLVLAIVVLGLIWAVQWGPLKDTNLGFLRSPAGSTVQPAAPSPGPAAPDTSPPKVRRQSTSPKEGGRSVQAEGSTATSEQVSAAVAPSPTTVPPLKFPTAVDVPLGTLGSAVVDSFGPPAARTLAVDNDRVEMFIYRRSRPDTSTVIQTRNGRVVSAVTTAY